MDQAVVQFQKAAARENRDGGSVRRRYSSTLQRQAVEYSRERQRQGDGRRDVAAALGVAPWSLYRWTRASEERARFHQVQVARPAVRSAGAAPVVIMTAGVDVQAFNAHTVRGPVVGRKNHYGSRSLRGTEVAAACYTLCETARLVGVDPRAYHLRAVHAAIGRPGTVTFPEDLLASTLTG